VDYNLPSPTHGDPYTVPSSVSGKQSEPKLLPIGPNPHMVQSLAAVREQRLRKKILKLITQRDHWKTEYENLRYILRLFPYVHAERDYKRNQETSEKLKRLLQYDTMIPLLVSENERLKKQVESLQKVADANEFPK
jgi:hypothetical protein